MTTPEPHDEPTTVRDAWLAYLRESTGAPAPRDGADADGARTE